MQAKILRITMQAKKVNMVLVTKKAPVQTDRIHLKTRYTP